MFNPDRPIDSADQDLLRRSPFAASLGQSLLNYTGTESVVVGLFGAWGSGKTSILNMALQHIMVLSEQLSPSDKPIVIRFYPWNFSDQNQLIGQFFRQISSALKKKDYASAVKEIGEHLESYATLFEPVALVTPIGPFALFLSKWVKGWGSAAKNIATSKSSNLASLKKELNELLSKQSRKIIVVIDDIDRLNNTEIRQIFQLVKSLGDFKNTIYVLAFDKDVVITALSRVQEGSGIEYLEKVVQVPFEVPAISKEEVHALLFNQLNQLIKDLPTGKWNQSYWGNLWHAALKHMFGDIRDVTRYVNSLRFSFEMVKGDVNPVDFLAIIALQVFLPEAYYGVRDNKDLFSGVLASSLGYGDSGKQQAKQRADKVLGRVPSFSSDLLQDLLTRMFPKLGAVYGNTHYGSEWLSTWRGDCRICSPDMFDTYFRLHIPKGDLSQTEIETILSLAETRETFSEALEALNNQGRIFRFLDRLEDFTKDKIPEAHIDNIVCSLMDMGDLFPDGDPGFVDFDTPMRILRIFYQLSHRFSDIERRFCLFRNAIDSATRSIHTIVHEVSVQDQQHGRHSTHAIPEPEDRLTVSPNELDKLEELALSKIESWAASGRLSSHSKLPYILFRWKEWGKDEDVRKFVESTISTTSGLIDFLTSFLSKSMSYSEGDYVGKHHWMMHLKTIQEFVELESIEGKVRALLKSSPEQLTDHQRVALQVFIGTFDGKSREPF